MNIFASDTYHTDAYRDKTIFIDKQGKSNIEVDREIRALLEQNMPRSDDSYYEIEYGEIKTVSVSGYPGGQPTGSYCFPSGGSVNFTTDSGTPVSASVSFGGPFGTISVGIPLGTASSVTGYSVNIPASNKYYKIYVTRTVEVQPYIIWIYPYFGETTKTLYDRVVLISKPTTIYSVPIEVS